MNNTKPYVRTELTLKEDMRSGNGQYTQQKKNGETLFHPVRRICFYSETLTDALAQFKEEDCEEIIIKYPA